MAKYGVTKTQLSQKFLHGFFWKFDKKGQIDVGEDTESFAPISATVLSYRENPAGAEPAPSSKARVNTATAGRNIFKRISECRKLSWPVCGAALRL